MSHRSNPIWSYLLLLFFGLTVASRFDLPQVELQRNGSSPLPLESWTGKRLLFICAHVDDMEGSSAGLVSMLKGKVEVSLLILTNGDKGCGNPEYCTNKTNADVAGIRQKEQMNSAQILGIPAENIYFLSYEDCLLATVPTSTVVPELVGWIRQIKPHIIITWDPTPRFELIPSQAWQDLGFHPDHQVSGKLALDAAWIAHEDRLWPQMGPGWRPEQVYFFSFTPATLPTHYLDITGEPFQTKYESFLQMKSQYLPGQEKEMEAFFALLGSRIASQIGLPIGRFAEAYNYVLW